MVGIGSSAEAARSLSEISPPASAMISSSSNTRSTDCTVPDRASATDSWDIPYPLDRQSGSTIQKQNSTKRESGLMSRHLTSPSFDG